MKFLVIALLVASASAQFVYPYYGYSGFAHPFAPVAPYTVKAAVLEADKDAKTPAATTFLGAKEVVTPLAYSYGYHPYAFPYAYPVVAAPAADAEKKVESSRKKRQVPVFPYAASFYHYAPAQVKYEVKTAVAEADESAKTPASTTKFDTKVVTKEFTAPVAAPVVAAPVAAPYAYTYHAAPYAFPYATYPFGYPVVAAPAADAEKKVESSRKKRQVFVAAKPSQFYNDLLYKSVDLNQDGQPDKAVYTAPVSAYPYAAYPYTYGFPFFG